MRWSLYAEIWDLAQRHRSLSGSVAVILIPISWVFHSRILRHCDPAGIFGFVAPGKYAEPWHIVGLPCAFGSCSGVVLISTIARSDRTPHSPNGDFHAADGIADSFGVV